MAKYIGIVDDGRRAAAAAAAAAAEETLQALIIHLILHKAQKNKVE
jgi:hypothetical protein